MVDARCTSLKNVALLGIDIGATQTKIVLMRPWGELLALRRQDTWPLITDTDCSNFVAQLSAFSLSNLSDDDELLGVGIAVAGVVSKEIASDKIRLSFAPNLKISLATFVLQLKGAFSNCQFCFLNDANAAALAESRIGAGKGVSSMLFVTLGTGVGAGYVLDGHIVVGAHGAAAEIGHLKVGNEGRICGCGKVDCLEQYVSAACVVQSYVEMCTELSEKPSCADVFEACAAGDVVGCEVVNRFSVVLGKALAQLACVMDPEIILLGGGISQSASLFLPTLRHVFESTAIEVCRDIRIDPSSLGTDAGAIGAALSTYEA